MDQDDARQRLLARLAELLEEERGSVEDRAPVSLQQDSVGRLSRMDAIQQQAMAQATQRRRDDEARRIEAALERIREGEWGWCLACGEEIPQGRLERDAAATLCIACADRR
jgi:DnaK suppressor protein